VSVLPVSSIFPRRIQEIGAHYDFSERRKKQTSPSAPYKNFAGSPARGSGPHRHKNTVANWENGGACAVLVNGKTGTVLA